MKSLVDALKLKKSISTIHGDNFENIIDELYENNIYKFNLNSELIDVNNRFRIFNFNNKNYIVKKSSLVKGEKEIELALQAKRIIDNMSVGKFKVKVVVPTIVKIKNNCYLITEYYGNTLQEHIYLPEIKNSFKIDILALLLEKLISLGILYRGFLPRNTILKDDIIYLFDWEDVIFVNNQEEKVMNKLWETNFLLNWGYFFDMNELKKIIFKYSCPNYLESPLLNYEKKFALWNNYDLDKSVLRNLIIETVFYAEQQLNLKDEYFSIPPNDLAHLISDLFNTDIDVLFDISCFVLRKRNERIYFNLNKMISNLIIKNFCAEKNIQKDLIFIILLLFEASTNSAYDKLILDYDFKSNEIISFLKSLNSELISMLLNNKILEFHDLLKIYLEKLFVVYQNNENFVIRNINELTNYIYSLKEGEKNDDL